MTMNCWIGQKLRSLAPEPELGSLIPCLLRGAGPSLCSLRVIVIAAAAAAVVLACFCHKVNIQHFISKWWFGFTCPQNGRGTVSCTV